MADDARRFVQDIAREHGYLGEEVYSRMDARTRLLVEEAQFKKDVMIGASVITLAKNLYSKDVRFIFELLQNADDNNFLRASRTGTAPYVTFNVYKDRIVVDCNEDGFTEENLTAICNVGKSSKTGAQGYIGEKGIGFKSVFKVAWKVHIQSGHYSFTFTHRKGESGMGMISPEWKDVTEKLSGPLTRMTLFLHDDYTVVDSDERQGILHQLNTLQPAMLLFLKKLKQINVHVYDKDGKEISSSLLSKDDTSQVNRPVLESINTNGENSEHTKQKYHVVETIARNLPRNENREYTIQEESSRAYGNAPVVLAFPLSDADVPLIAPQAVFAFLPVRRVGFNFLIHSDFVTQANREDIVTSSSRNLRLLDAIADAFIVAVREFCLHPKLKYQWMRYLPKLKLSNDDSWDPFWQKLVDKIRQKISNEDVLVLRTGTSLRKIQQGRRLYSMLLDQHGDPLFDDLPGDKASYLSTFYLSKHLDLLKDYGLDYLYQDEFRERVKNDLLSSTSRMRSTTDNDWHTRTARCLNFPFEKGWVNDMAETKALQIIPLTDGRWVSQAKFEVYFAELSNGLQIPTGLGFHLVDPAAARLPERKALFTNLGVQEASVDKIRNKILLTYQSTGPRNLEASLSHLKFLYLTHNSKHSTFTYQGISLYDTSEELCPKGHDIHCLDTAQYSLWQLRNKVDADKLRHWPKNIHFTNKKYLENTPSGPQQHDVVWKDWLHQYLGVRRHPRIFKLSVLGHDVSALSEECQFVAENLPSELLGFLRYSWNSEKFGITPERTEALKALSVPCQGEEMVPLSETYLPSPQILERRGEFMRNGEFFPLLDFGDDSGKLSQWDFLLDFGVKTSPDLDFYIDILEHIQFSNPDPSDLVDPSRVLHLYLRIQMECSDTSDENVRKVRRSKIRTFFEENDGIFVPSWEQVDSSWVEPDDCTLDGPISMRTLYPVLPLYRAAFVKSNLDFPNLTTFLRDTLEIPKCSWNHIVDELKSLKTSDCEKSEVQGLYKYLEKMKLSGDAFSRIKDVFETEALIFADVGPQKWHKLSQCLWSAPASIRGKVNLSTVYGDEMQDFFLNKLGVRKLDANVVYQELLELNLKEATVDHVKDLLWTMNSQLELDTPKGSAETLLKRPIIPIRDVGGRVSLQSSSTEFAIVDRKTLDEIFGRRVKALDFTTNEICQLRAFIKWAGLEDRYLSRLVKETSVLDSGVKVPISDPRQDISKKAYGLLRIASNFNSPRVEGDGQGFYDILRQSRTWEAEKISTTLVVSIDGQTVTEEVDRGDVHIDDANGLDIYVPYDERRRDDAYLTNVPNRLAKWMMTDPATRTNREVDPNAAFLIQTVLLVKVSQLDRYLNDHGVIEAAIPEQTEQEDNSSLHQFTIPLASTPTAVESLTPQRVVSPPSEPRTPRPETPLFDVEDAYSEQETPATDLSSFLTPSPSFRAGNSTRFARESLSPDPHIARLFERENTTAQEYAALLSQVVSAAKRSHLLDGPMNLSGLLDGIFDRPVETKTFNEYDLFGPGIPQIERDKKVGAAGELFVFELLSSMSPAAPGFSRENWTSTIRKYATAHPQYADMESWRGIETSDLHYKDDFGTLTEALIAKGHLQSRWRRKWPQYYIEVKSTPGPWDTPFFMSHAQWTKMKRLSTDNSIYVIFRVHDLYSDRIGMNIYVDPARLADEGRLAFTADRWTVKPLVQ
ncbi:hypothetical protein M434DRAFT_399722 [Hypoxylon sp. CO27-5]|nr:hypothetical protein M434DRAFT_399722 [Hypoxylon sp. CO27-5]